MSSTSAGFGLGETSGVEEILEKPGVTTAGAGTATGTAAGLESRRARLMNKFVVVGLTVR